jgi:ferrochelatase
MKQPLLLVNFGGPRNLDEIEPFLAELLTDRELIRTKLPTFWHNLLFRRIAKKRAKKIRVDYELIGGNSPIYETTETLAALLREKTGRTVLTFHRYLPSTHAASLLHIEKIEGPVLVFPLFPQFSYATTGSIAALFQGRLSLQALRKLRWIKSYPAHPAFTLAWTTHIRTFLKEQEILEEDAFFLFSAHGLPQAFIDAGDPYEFECQASVKAVMQCFPKAKGELAYQSKFGRGEWLRPYTQEWCEKREEIGSTVVFIPIAFTSDHIETLFEVEYLYLPILQKKGVKALRCPSFNQAPIWIEAMLSLLEEKNLTNTQMLVR